MRKLGLNGNRQKVVQIGEVKRLIEEGWWEYCPRCLRERQSSGCLAAGWTYPLVHGRSESRAAHELERFSSR